MPVDYMKKLLDVYKRQEQDSVIKGEILKKIFKRWIIYLITLIFYTLVAEKKKKKWYNIEAVSYTHLDVYKRQHEVLQEHFFDEFVLKKLGEL